MLIAIALFVVAYFLFESGLSFLAMLCVLLGVLSLAASGRENKTQGNVKMSEPYGPNGPIIVEQKMPDVPRSIAIKIKPKWKDLVPFEYSWANFGWVLDRFGHLITSLLLGKKK